MTTVKEKKVLSPKQYEFYKRKGMSDEKVMQLHGYNTVSLNAWKKENNLIGVKFDRDTTESGVKVTKATPAEEKAEAPNETARDFDKTLTETLVQLKEKFVARQGSNKNNTEATESDSKVEDKQIPSEPIKQPEGAVKEELNAYEKMEEMQKAHYEQKKWLENRHKEDDFEIGRLRSELKAAKERGNDFCDRLVEAQRKYTEENAKLLNLRNHVKKQDELLLKYKKMEDYLFQTMELAQDQRNRYLAECGEQ